ncbi:TPA_asm: hypothetical protein GNB58_005286 [Salmonella enterica subsp. houtenae serovar 45:g,z51:-]|uniref:Uncharacterized protein n=1 Tax=Salmonella enterica subsp. houtenae serovar 45:g,z51:- TaxID=1967611 RepID=A0A736VFL3_SALHO|nr:hypothetical protein [Salmonella enterica subsp. houtenae str. CFSAN000557]HAE7768094.1 hypothetical protein [Salmonella enterica subsp. houtenae serovar 45:g,z51:-]
MGDRKDSFTFGNKPESYKQFNLYNRISVSINERLIRVVGTIEFHSVKCGRNVLNVSQKDISPFNVSLLHSFRLFLRQRKLPEQVIFSLIGYEKLFFIAKNIIARNERILTVTLHATDYSSAGGPAL